MTRRIFLLLVFVIALGLRLYGVNWDNGFHLHPDERAIHMVSDSISLFSQLNPRFFNYGSLPIYLLSGSAQLIDHISESSSFASYNGYLILGRLLSVGFDLTTLSFVIMIAQLLSKNWRVSIFSGFFYAIAFFPIQNSHFYVVDVLLNLLAIAVIYLLIRYYLTRRLIWIFLISITSAAIIATKFTGVIFVLVVFSALVLLSRKSLRYVLIYSILSSITFFLFMPYAFLDFTTFKRDIMLQLTMNSDPYIFPYTLQYVSTLPYFYYLKNIFLWGLGPFISIASLYGFISFSAKIKKYNLKPIFPFILFFTFYFLYFLIVGRSETKFMRYLLPLYPFFCLFAGMGLYDFYKSRFFTSRLIFLVIIAGSLLWTFAFVNIYRTKHTRIQATDWIINNIKQGSTLAVEHWDDRLPLTNSDKFLFEELPFYERPDDEEKWKKIRERLAKSDYIIIASNRLYTPLQKLSDCNKYRSCYPLTARYYRDLFSEKLPFKKIAEFTSYPKLTLGAWKLEINDDSADESFTVYDHPKIIIFQRSR